MQWISVEDRLPEEKGMSKVLVYFKNVAGWHVDVRRFSQQMGRFIDGEWETMESVTHWMPLPKPPEGN